MNYNINITKGYPALLNLDNTSGIKTYFSIEPHCGNDKIVVSVENLEMNADGDLWCRQAIAENPNGLFAKVQDIYDSEFSVASFLLRQAKIVAEGDVTYCMCLSNNKESIYHTLPVSFSKGSKYIWLSGKSLDYKSSDISMCIFFSGDLRILFEDKDAMVQMVEFKSNFNVDDVGVINKSQEVFNGLRGKGIERDTFNHIKSPFFDFDFLIECFEHSEYFHSALRDFPVLKCE